MLLGPELFSDYLIGMKHVLFCFIFLILCFPQKQTAYPYLSHNWQDLQLFLESLKNFLCPKDMHKGTGISAFSAMVSDTYHSYTTEKRSLPVLYL